jgi:hypothetical protein
MRSLQMPIKFRPSKWKLDWPKKGIVETKSDSKKDANLETFQIEKGNQVFCFEHFDPQKASMKTAMSSSYPGQNQR